MRSTAVVAAVAVVVVVGWLVSLGGSASAGALVVLSATHLLLIGAVVRLRRLSRRLAAESPVTATAPTPGRGPESRSGGAVSVPVETGVLTWMRHEIRTPINAITGLTDLLSEGNLTPTERDYLEDVRASADLLTAIINDIHDLCRLEVGGLRLDAEPFDLRDAVEVSLDQIAAMAAARDLDLAYSIDEGTPPTLVGDVVRLRQILVTLLTNAVKRTRGGEVTVLVSARPVAPNRYEVHFTVRDTGISISDEQRARMFHSLDQIVASGERPGDAHELGVALCWGLAHLMGGTIGLDVGARGGATFQFTIVVDALNGEPPAYLSSAQQQLANRRVLVVDYAVDNREGLVRSLAGWGAVTRATDSPSEALTWIRQGETFDVAIIAARLPGEAAARLAAEIEGALGPAAPALVMLHGPEPRSSTRVKRSGALVQPVGPAQLLDVLIRALERPPVATLPLPGTAPLHILLAEDNPVSRKVALGVLERLGHRVDVATDGRQVLEAVERQPYDVVLMDMQMPEMDGVMVTRHLCERWPRDRRPGIIALSASEWPEDRARWLAAGAEAFVSKTLPVEELQRALARAASPQVGRTRGPAPAPVQDDVRGHLRQLETGRMPGLGAQVFDIFLQDTSARLAALQDAVARRDGDAVERVAHSLQGSAAMVGAASMARRCAELIGLARSGSLDGAEAIVMELEARFEAIQRSDTRVLAQDASAQTIEPRVYE
jgi:CheY-like chemotaxis protein/HPt (histidine-containing phosphotransfer) domain-containing protein